MPHRNTTYCDAACRYRPSGVVCLSVDLSVSLSVCRSVTLVSPAKTAEPIEMPFGLRTRVGPGNHVLDGGSKSPMGRGNFEGEGASHCEVYGHSEVPWAKTAESIKMPFGFWARMGRRNHVLDGGSAVLRDVAMATNFLGTQFAVTGFVGYYNFGCMIASDTLFDARVGFRGQAIR